MRPIISAENLSKRYRLGARQTAPTTIREALAGAVRSPVRRLKSRLRSADLLWALKDINFEVRPGEVVGVIGHNGAGKSTLLKILSRITEPTTGRVALYGRVGSLLEVGTGFHPDLTGRENVYLNGAILGMHRAEIKRKFDEIVAFAEVDRFIDTPVKHYSSGMHMRLAFAVAAHLEPEILIVDEVLAVGDAAFQKKSMGKMGNAAREGRTVLFVSHNMQAVSQLTQRCLLFSGGRCLFDGPTADAVNQYDALQATGQSSAAFYENPADAPGIHLAAARVDTSDEHGVHRWGHPIAFDFTLRVPDLRRSLCFSFQVVNELQQPVCHFWPVEAGAPYRQRPGTYRLRCEVPKFRLYMGSYKLTTWLTDRRDYSVQEKLIGICPFEVTMRDTHRDDYDWVAGTCAYLEEAAWAPIETVNSPG